jgi:hypothetical protein
MVITWLHILKDISNEWGSLIQILLNLSIAAITIYLMYKYGENRKMIFELKKQTKSLNSQLSLLTSINAPCLIIYYESGQQPRRVNDDYHICTLKNIGSPLKNLHQIENNSSKITFGAVKHGDTIYKYVVIRSVSMKFSETDHPTRLADITIGFSDELGNSYIQVISKVKHDFPTINGPIRIN